MSESLTREKQVTLLDLLDRIQLRHSRLAVALPDIFCPLRHLTDLESYYDHLKMVFPHEAQAIHRIKKEAMEFCRVMDAFMQLTNQRIQTLRDALTETPAWLLRHAADMKGILKFIRLFNVPIEEYLRTFVRDQNLIRFLSVGYRGNPASFSLSFLYTMMDYYYPARGGVQAIPDLLAQSITENGGEILYKSLVERIILEKGRAAGVLLRGRERIRSRFVVNNGDIRRTFLKMVPHDAVSEAYRSRLQTTDVSESVFSVYLGVDMPTEAIQTRGCGHMFLMPTYNTLDMTEIHTNPDFYRHTLLMIMVPTLHDPFLAPPGKSVVILQCAASSKSLDAWGARGGRRTKKYRTLKKEIAGQLIANAEQVIPGLSNRIELQIESTPFTLQRYTLNTEGAAVGWNCHPRETYKGGLRGIFGSSNTPIRNLYQVGHWAMCPGGAPAGFITGKMVSSVIQKRLHWNL